ncbi:MAG TPA: hypothetical protein VN257_05610 [Actinotalea sp.]|nr:hypothetical protein [Actinotalea sp.]
MSENSTQKIPTTDPTEPRTSGAESTPATAAGTAGTPATAAGAAGTIPIPPTADEPRAAPDPRPRLRVGTVVWGLVVAAVGVGLIALASGVTFDVELAVIVLVAATGLTLLVGSLATSLRRRER